MAFPVLWFCVALTECLSGSRAMCADIAQQLALTHAHCPVPIPSDILRRPTAWVEIKIKLVLELRLTKEHSRVCPSLASAEHLRQPTSPSPTHLPHTACFFAAFDISHHLTILLASAKVSPGTPTRVRRLSRLRLDPRRSSSTLGVLLVRTSLITLTSYWSPDNVSWCAYQCRLCSIRPPFPRPSCTSNQSVSWAV